MARTPIESQKVKELGERLERDHYWQEKHDSTLLVAEIEKMLAHNAMKSEKRAYNDDFDLDEIDRHQTSNRVQKRGYEPDLQIGDRNLQQTLSSAPKRGYEPDLQTDTDTEAPNSGVDYET